MKTTIVAALLLSICSIAFADETEEQPAPITVTPIEIMVCRLVGDPVSPDVPTSIEVFESIDSQGNSLEQGMMILQTQKQYDSLPDPVTVRSIYDTTVRVVFNEDEVTADVTGLFNDDSIGAFGLELEDEISTLIGQDLYECKPTGLLEAQLRALKKPPAE